MLGFEDLWGEKNATGGMNQNSDRDFNDAVFVIDIGEDNVRNLIKPVPEPTMTLGLIGVGAVGVVMRRRRQAAEQA
jgi:PEP-CTERM motif